MAMEESSDKPSMLESDDISVIKQVALTVPTTDDPTLPVITFRMWVLGTISCVMLSFVNQFFWYREQPISIDSTAAMIAAVPLGHLMAKTITKRVFFQGTPWSFTLNPGPFNVKEHVLIVIFANSGAGSVYAMHIVSAVKLFYKRNLTFFVSLILIMTTQVLGFGIAGIFRRYLVDPAEMWWPSNLVDVSLYGALHDKRKSRSKGGMTRTQFFMIALICSFAYYVLPGYLFPMLTSLSWVCWVFPKSVLAHQLGSGMKGLGLGSVSLDWATVVSYLGSPFVSPWFATANIAVGYGLLMYVVTPIAYWFDIYKAKTFPFYSSKLFMSSGRKYDISKIVNSNFNIDLKAYAQQGQLHLSSLFALSYGFGFAALPATLVHTAIFHGREIMELSRSSFGRKKMDVHTRLMQKYKQVPQWWFIAILVVNLAIVILTCVFFKDQVQLPWWGVLLAFSISIIYTLPIGILSATANSAPGLNIITEYVLGYLYPGRPVANMCFKVYGYISMTQALTFLGDLKIGHYMKIPPRSMFMAQVVGTIISSFVYLLTGWMLMSSIPNLCDTSALPADSPWTCPLDTVFYDASIIWGLIGPRRIFGDLGVYGSINWFFLLGAVSPIIVWLVQKVFPKQKWISLINIPVIFSATGIIPPASSLNYNAWIVLAFISGFVVFRYKQDLWKRYNYILSGGLDAGVAFMSVLLFFTLSSTSIQWWGNDSDGCPLATCPTAKGVIVNGCPIV